MELREILLKEKPTQMLEVSPKGTVPVAAFSDGLVIDESLELMLWALAHADETSWLEHIDDSLALIWQNDTSFKSWLNKYKYHVRYPEHTIEYYRDQCAAFLDDLEARLGEHPFLLSAHPQLADLALFPFIRQFSLVDIEWFETSSYQGVKRWLDHWLESKLFAAVMHKYAVWDLGQPPVFLPMDPSILSERRG